jgi:RNA-dependent RNA polymerase
MGRLSHIKNVAKYAARLGQCFSTTRLMRCISSPQIVKIPDVERNGHCFTDGVGKISPFLAQMVAEDWGVPGRPSAFQFRMGGCKGVLVTWPDARGTEVHVRKSQEKFSAEFNGLEIVRCSHHSAATLNRQSITVLSCLGVPNEAFVELMDQQLENYKKAEKDEKEALRLLRQHVDQNQMTPTIARMVKDGFMETREPFVLTMLKLWISWSMKLLKEKARIVVENGAFVLGCVDETGTLRGYTEATAGRRCNDPSLLPQIFIQIPSTEAKTSYKVITGLCLVGRNPSLHPGDIRVVEAVDIPALRHIRDVVVFPRNGDCDVPSMLSGGDLDGDDFFVIWDSRLLPRRWNYPPMNYSAPATKEENREPTVKDLKTFFVLYMKNDQLPLIAHAHLAWADWLREGARHEICE